MKIVNLPGMDGFGFVQCLARMGVLKRASFCDAFALITYKNGRAVFYRFTA